jgi:MFS family permease
MSKTNAAHINWIIAATSFGFVVSQLDVTIVNVALPKMGENLQAPISGLQWVVDAYTLLFASLLLSAGALGDQMGARRVYVAGLVLFAAASLGCGLAPDAAVLIGAAPCRGPGPRCWCRRRWRCSPMPAATMRSCGLARSGCGPLRAASPSPPGRWRAGS